MKLKELIEKNNLDLEIPEVWNKEIMDADYKINIEKEEGYDIYVFTKDADGYKKLDIVIDPTLMRLTYFITDEKGTFMSQYNQQGELIEFID